MFRSNALLFTLRLPAYTPAMRTICFVFLAACTGTGGECLRVDDWRDPIVMDSDSVTVQITEDCAGEITITEARLSGPGFEADLPAVGDIVDGSDFEVEIRFTSDSPEAGKYQATLEIAGDGLVDMPARDVSFTVGEPDGDGSDTGLSD